MVLHMNNIFRNSGLIILILVLHSCKEKQTPPVVQTTAISDVTYTMATSGGIVTNEGVTPVVSKGVCWSTSANPTITNSMTIDGMGLGAFFSNITKLSPNTKYYVRAYATNSAGTAYGNEFILKTRSALIVTDLDGNIYNTVTIGTQLWMAENLKTTKYKDNTNIPIVTDDVTWSGTGSSAYCWYNYNVTNKEKYGALYNWYTINSGKLCPQGWHVPSDPEWTTLTTFLGGELAAGGKLKESGTTNWLSPNSAATNETGFAALPGGANSATSSFTSINTNAYFWSSTEYNAGASWPRGIHHDSGEVFRLTAAKKNGMSVRCIKD